MKLIVINSNSAGNAYALDTGKEILLLESGCKMADVKRAIDFRISDVVGCLVTHEHGDHAKYSVEYAKFGVEVYGVTDIGVKKNYRGRTDIAYTINGIHKCPYSRILIRKKQ